jgi:hypothetical protein
MATTTTAAAVVAAITVAVVLLDNDPNRPNRRLIDSVAIAVMVAIPVEITVVTGVVADSGRRITRGKRDGEKALAIAVLALVVTIERFI